MRVDHRDAAGGLALVGFGAALAFYSHANYALGTLRRMGPGMVPTSLGVLICIAGAIILISSLSRSTGGGERLEWRSLVGTMASLASFALLMPRLGLVPTIIIMTLLASLITRTLGLLQAFALSLALAAIAVAIFTYALNLQMPLATWPL
jgi:hypothetical protein